MHTSKRGEIVTLITTAVVILIGITTFVTTTFLNKKSNKISYQPRAQDCPCINGYDACYGEPCGGPPPPPPQDTPAPPAVGPDERPTQAPAPQPQVTQAPAPCTTFCDESDSRCYDYNKCYGAQPQVTQAPVSTPPPDDDYCDRHPNAARCKPSTTTTATVPVITQPPVALPPEPPKPPTSTYQAGDRDRWKCANGGNCDKCGQDGFWDAGCPKFVAEKGYKDAPYAEHYLWEKQVEELKKQTAQTPSVNATKTTVPIGSQPVVDPSLVNQNLDASGNPKGPPTFIDPKDGKAKPIWLLSAEGRKAVENMYGAVPGAGDSSWQCSNGGGNCDKCGYAGWYDEGCVTRHYIPDPNKKPDDPTNWVRKSAEGVPDAKAGWQVKAVDECGAGNINSKTQGCEVLPARLIEANLESQGYYSSPAKCIKQNGGMAEMQFSNATCDPVSDGKGNTYYVYMTPEDKEKQLAKQKVYSTAEKCGADINNQAYLEQGGGSCEKRPDGLYQFLTDKDKRDIEWQMSFNKDPKKGEVAYLTKESCEGNARIDGGVCIPAGTYLGTQYYQLITGTEQVKLLEQSGVYVNKDQCSSINKIGLHQGAGTCEKTPDGLYQFVTEEEKKQQIANFENKITQSAIQCQRTCEEHDAGRCIQGADGLSHCSTTNADDKALITYEKEKNCGGRWQPPCTTTTKIAGDSRVVTEKKEFNCAPGLKPGINGGICIPDESYEKTQAVAGYIKSQPELKKDELLRIISNNLTQQQIGEHLPEIQKQLCSACGGGECVYSDTKNNFACVSQYDIEQTYRDSNKYGVKGEFAGECNGWGPFQGCNGSNLTCASGDASGVRRCQLTEEGRRVAALNAAEKTGLVKDLSTQTINLGYLSNGKVQELSSNKQLAKGGACKQTGYNFTNGSCWECVDSGSGSYDQVANDNCLNPELKKVESAGFGCRGSGGYCAEGSGSGGGSDCPTGFSCRSNPKEGETIRDGAFVWDPVVKAVGLGQDCIRGESACADGLRCFNNKCQDITVLAHNDDFKKGTWSTNVEKAEIPIVSGFLSGLATSIFNRDEYAKAAEIRAAKAHKQILELEKLGNVDKDLGMRIFDSLDGAAKGKLANIRYNYEKERGNIVENDIWSGFAGNVFQAGNNFGTFMTAYGGDQGAKSTAFLDYAKAAVEIDAKVKSGKISGLEGYLNYAGAAVPVGFQVGQVVADVWTIGVGSAVKGTLNKGSTALLTQAGKNVVTIAKHEAIDIAKKGAVQSLREGGREAILPVLKYSGEKLGGNLLGGTKAVLHAPTALAEKFVEKFPVVGKIEQKFGEAMLLPIVGPLKATQLVGKFAVNGTKAVVDRVAPTLLEKVAEAPLIKTVAGGTIGKFVAGKEEQMFQQLVDRAYAQAIKEGKTPTKKFIQEQVERQINEQVMRDASKGIKAPKIDPEALLKKKQELARAQGKDWLAKTGTNALKDAERLKIIAQAEKDLAEATVKKAQEDIAKRIKAPTLPKNLDSIISDRIKDIKATGINPSLIEPAKFARQNAITAAQSVNTKVGRSFVGGRVVVGGQSEDEIILAIAKKINNSNPSKAVGEAKAALDAVQFGRKMGLSGEQVRAYSVFLSEQAAKGTPVSRDAAISSIIKILDRATVKGSMTASQKLEQRALNYKGAASIAEGLLLENSPHIVKPPGILTKAKTNFVNLFSSPEKKLANELAQHDGILALGKDGAIRPNNLHVEVNGEVVDLQTLANRSADGEIAFGFKGKDGANYGIIRQEVQGDTQYVVAKLGQDLKPIAGGELGVYTSLPEALSGTHLPKPSELGDLILPKKFGGSLERSVSLTKAADDSLSLASKKWTGLAKTNEQAVRTELELRGMAKTDIDAFITKMKSGQKESIFSGVGKWLEERNQQKIAKAQEDRLIRDGVSEAQKLVGAKATITDDELKQQLKAANKYTDEQIDKIIQQHNQMKAGGTVQKPPPVNQTEEYTIGRGSYSDNALILPNVSGKHAKVAIDKTTGEIIFTDTSTFGSERWDEALKKWVKLDPNKPERLQSGTKLRLGSHTNAAGKFTAGQEVRIVKTNGNGLYLIDELSKRSYQIREPSGLGRLLGFTDKNAQLVNSKDFTKLNFGGGSTAKEKFSWWEFGKRSQYERDALGAINSRLKPGMTEDEILDTIKYALQDAKFPRGEIDSAVAKLRKQVIFPKEGSLQVSSAREFDKLIERVKKGGSIKQDPGSIFLPQDAKDLRTINDYVAFLENCKNINCFHDKSQYQAIMDRLHRIFGKSRNLTNLTSEERLLLAARTIEVNRQLPKDIIQKMGTQIEQEISADIARLQSAGKIRKNLRLPLAEDIGQEGHQTMMFRSGSSGTWGQATDGDIKIFDIETLAKKSEAHQKRVAKHEHIHNIQATVNGGSFAPIYNTYSKDNPTYLEALTEWYTLHTDSGGPNRFRLPFGEESRYHDGVMRIQNWIDDAVRKKIINPSDVDRFVDAALTANYKELDAWLMQKGTTLDSILPRHSDFYMNPSSARGSLIAGETAQKTSQGAATSLAKPKGKLEQRLSEYRLNQTSSDNVIFREVSTTVDGKTVKKIALQADDPATKITVNGVEVPQNGVFLDESLGKNPHIVITQPNGESKELIYRGTKKDFFRRNIVVADTFEKPSNIVVVNKDTTGGIVANNGSIGVAKDPNGASRLVALDDKVTVTPKGSADVKTLKKGEEVTVGEGARISFDGQVGTFVKSKGGAEYIVFQGRDPIQIKGPDGIVGNIRDFFKPKEIRGKKPIKLEATDRANILTQSANPPPANHPATGQSGSRVAENAPVPLPTPGIFIVADNRLKNLPPESRTIKSGITEDGIVLTTAQDGKIVLTVDPADNPYVFVNGKQVGRTYLIEDPNAVITISRNTGDRQIALKGVVTDEKTGVSQINTEMREFRQSSEQRVVQSVRQPNTQNEILYTTETSKNGVSFAPANNNKKAVTFKIDEPDTVVIVDGKQINGGNGAKYIPTDRNHHVQIFNTKTNEVTDDFILKGTTKDEAGKLNLIGDRVNTPSQPIVISDDTAKGFFGDAIKGKEFILSHDPDGGLRILGTDKSEGLVIGKANKEVKIRAWRELALNDGDTLTLNGIKSTVKTTAGGAQYLLSEDGRVLMLREAKGLGALRDNTIGRFFDKPAQTLQSVKPKSRIVMSSKSQEQAIVRTQYQREKAITDNLIEQGRLAREERLAQEAQQEAQRLQQQEAALVVQAPQPSRDFLKETKQKVKDWFRPFEKEEDLAVRIAKQDTAGVVNEVGILKPKSFLVEVDGNIRTLEEQVETALPDQLAFAYKSSDGKAYGVLRTNKSGGKYIHFELTDDLKIPNNPVGVRSDSLEKVLANSQGGKVESIILPEKGAMKSTVPLAEAIDTSYNLQVERWKNMLAGNREAVVAELRARGVAENEINKTLADLERHATRREQQVAEGVRGLERMEKAYANKKAQLPTDSELKQQLIATGYTERDAAESVTRFNASKAQKQALLAEQEKARLKALGQKTKEDLAEQRKLIAEGDKLRAERAQDEANQLIAKQEQALEAKKLKEQQAAQKVQQEKERLKAAGQQYLDQTKRTQEQLAALQKQKAQEEAAQILPTSNGTIKPDNFHVDVNGRTMDLQELAAQTGDGEIVTSFKTKDGKIQSVFKEAAEGEEGYFDYVRYELDAAGGKVGRGTTFSTYADALPHTSSIDQIIIPSRTLPDGTQIPHITRSFTEAEKASTGLATKKMTQQLLDGEEQAVRTQLASGGMPAKDIDAFVSNLSKEAQTLKEQTAKAQQKAQQEALKAQKASERQQAIQKVRDSIASPFKKAASVVGDVTTDLFGTTEQKVARRLAKQERLSAVAGNEVHPGNLYVEIGDQKIPVSLQDLVKTTDQGSSVFRVQTKTGETIEVVRLPVEESNKLYRITNLTTGESKATDILSLPKADQINTLVVPETFGAAPTKEIAFDAAKSSSPKLAAKKMTQQIVDGEEQLLRTRLESGGMSKKDIDAVVSNLNKEAKLITKEERLARQEAEQKALKAQQEKDRLKALGQKAKEDLEEQRKMIAEGDKLRAERAHEEANQEIAKAKKEAEKTAGKRPQTTTIDHPSLKPVNAKGEITPDNFFVDLKGRTMDLQELAAQTGDGEIVTSFKMKDGRRIDIVREIAETGEGDFVYVLKEVDAKGNPVGRAVTHDTYTQALQALPKSSEIDKIIIPSRTLAGGKKIPQITRSFAEAEEASTGLASKKWKTMDEQGMRTELSRRGVPQKDADELVARVHPPAAPKTPTVKKDNIFVSLGKKSGILDEKGKIKLFQPKKPEISPLGKQLAEHPDLRPVIDVADTVEILPGNFHIQTKDKKIIDLNMLAEGTEKGKPVLGYREGEKGELWGIVKVKENGKTVYQAAHLNPDFSVAQTVGDTFPTLHQALRETNLTKSFDLTKYSLVLPEKIGGPLTRTVTLNEAVVNSLDLAAQKWTNIASKQKTLTEELAKRGFKEEQLALVRRETTLQAVEAHPSLKPVAADGKIKPNNFFMIVDDRGTTMDLQELAATTKDGDLVASFKTKDGKRIGIFKEAAAEEGYSDYVQYELQSFTGRKLGTGKTFSSFEEALPLSSDIDQIVVPHHTLPDGTKVNGVVWPMSEAEKVSSDLATKKWAAMDEQAIRTELTRRGVSPQEADAIIAKFHPEQTPEKQGVLASLGKKWDDFKTRFGAKTSEKPVQQSTKTTTQLIQDILNDKKIPFAQKYTKVLQRIGISVVEGINIELRKRGFKWPWETQSQKVIETATKKTTTTVSGGSTNAIIFRTIPVITTTIKNYPNLTTTPKSSTVNICACDEKGRIVNKELCDGVNPCATETPGNCNYGEWTDECLEIAGNCPAGSGLTRTSWCTAKSTWAFQYNNCATWCDPNYLNQKHTPADACKGVPARSQIDSKNLKKEDIPKDVVNGEKAGVYTSCDGNQGVYVEMKPFCDRFSQVQWAPTVRTNIACTSSAGQSKSNRGAAVSANVSAAGGANPLKGANNEYYKSCLAEGRCVFPLSALGPQPDQVEACFAYHRVDGKDDCRKIKDVTTWGTPGNVYVSLGFPPGTRCIKIQTPGDPEGHEKCLYPL